MKTGPISRIVQVGAIGDPRVSDRRLIPFLTVDCSTDSSLERAIELHGSSDTPGDVVTTWCWQPLSKKHVFLKLDFQRPYVASTCIAFEVAAQGYAIDWIRSVHGLYLQSARYGLTVSQGMGNPSVLVEIPHDATFPIWDRLYDKTLKKQFLARGVSKNNIKGAIEEYKLRRKEFWFRFSNTV